MVFDVKLFEKIKERYGISYANNREEFVIKLALKGYSYMYEENAEEVKKISDYLSQIVEHWSDDVLYTKYYLYRAQVSSLLNENELHYLKKALEHSKKFGDQNISHGILLQIADTEFKEKKYDSALETLENIKTKVDITEVDREAYYELKSRIYWQLDDYKKGFEATYEWFKSLVKNSDDIITLFIVIVYLLTVMSSVDLSKEEDKLSQIRSEIEQVMSSIAKQTTNLEEVIDSLDILFAESVAIVQPSFLDDFADLLLRTTRWMNPSRYLYLALKLIDVFVNLEKNEKALQIVELAINYAKEQKYDKILYSLKVKKIELSNIVFYFVPIKPYFETERIDELEIHINGISSKRYLQPYCFPSGIFPSASYSHFITMLKDVKEPILYDKTFSIKGLPDEEEREYFILEMEIGEEQYSLLLKQEYRTDIEHDGQFKATVLPHYTIMGQISEKKEKPLIDVYDIEKLLLRLQKAMNCPISSIRLIFPEDSSQLKILRYYIYDKEFKSLKVHLKKIARDMADKYPIVKNNEFLKILDIDPITLFDLSLRTTENIEPLLNMINDAYGYDLDTKTFKQFIVDILEKAISKSSPEYLEEFYHNYSWLQLKAELFDERKSLEEKLDLCERMQKIANTLHSEEKKLEVIFFQIINEYRKTNIISQELVKKLLEMANVFESEKYQGFAQILLEIKHLEPEPSSEQLEKTLGIICRLSETHGSIDKTEEIFYLLLSQIGLDTAFEYCLYKKTLKCHLTPIVLDFINKLIEHDKIDKAHILLEHFKTSLNTEKKEKKSFSSRWLYSYTQTNLLLYDLHQGLIDISKSDDRKELEIIIDDILEYHTWVNDPVKLVEILIDKIKCKLQCSAYCASEPYVNWIDQVIQMNIPIFKEPQNVDILERARNIQNKVIDQHYH